MTSVLNRPELSRWWVSEPIESEYIQALLKNPESLRHRNYAIKINKGDHLDSASADGQTFGDIDPELLVSDGRWIGLSAAAKRVNPSVYYKQLVREESPTVKTVLLSVSSCSIWEWLDLRATSPIVAVTLWADGMFVCKLEPRSPAVRFLPFQGGLPKYSLRYTELVVKVELESPGELQAHGYYTNLPKQQPLQRVRMELSDTVEPIAALTHFDLVRVPISKFPEWYICDGRLGLFTV